MKDFEIVIEFPSDDDTKPSARMLMYLPEKKQLTVKGLLALVQEEARDQEIIGKDDRVTRLKFPGSNRHPGGLSISLSTPLSHLLKPILEKCEERSDDVLLLCAVVYRAHSGGPETRLPPSTEGLIKEEVKDGPVPTSGDQGSGNDAIVLLSDDEGDQELQDAPMMSVSGAEAASSGGESSANGGTLGGSPAAPPQTLPEASTSSSAKAEKHGDDGVPGGSGRQNLRRSARDRKKTAVKPTETSGDGVLHLSSVVSRAPPGRPEMRIASSTEGLSKQEVKAEDSPVAASGDQGSGDDVGSPAAPPPTPEANTSSLSRSVREETRRAATSKGKRKQPDGEEGGPSCAGRQRLGRAAQRKGQTAAITDLPMNEDSQRRQEITTRGIDEAKKNGCECGRVRQPHLGLPGASGKKDARWCSKCPSKPNNAVDVWNKRCECGSRRPAFGLPGSRGVKDARWCSQCTSKPINAVNVVSRLCECRSRQPTFGLPGASGTKDARWCSQCPLKPNDAVDVRNKRCECGSRQPTFGLPGGSGMKDARWCSQCPSKPINAVDVMSKRCECWSRQPAYGLPGGSGKKDARWCSQCPSKPDNAVDVVHKRCECGSRQPTFGLPGASGKKAARWCSQCPSKPKNAVYVRNKR